MKATNEITRFHFARPKKKTRITTASYCAVECVQEISNIYEIYNSDFTRDIKRLSYHITREIHKV